MNFFSSKIKAVPVLISTDEAKVVVHALRAAAVTAPKPTDKMRAARLANAIEKRSAFK